ncbi:MAG: hypothetical protein ACRC8S_01815 [Fimbriiglobus sp.]
MTVPRRSRNALFHAAFAWLAGLSLLHVLMEQRHPEWRDPEYGHRVKQCRTTHPDLVLLGSSRVQMGLNPAAMTFPQPMTVYNFAQSGCGPMQELVIFERLLAADVRPRSIAVEILPALLTTLPTDEMAGLGHRWGWRDRQTLRDSGLSVAWHPPVNPLHTHRHSLLSHLKLGRFQHPDSRQDFLWKQLRPGGWMPYFHETISDDKRQANYVTTEQQYRAKLMDFNIQSQQAEVYARLIERAQSERISIRFFTMPEAPRFQTWWTSTGRERFAVYCDELAAKCGRPVIHLHQTSDGEELFADGHHLLRHGATIVSERFSWHWHASLNQ